MKDVFLKIVIVLLIVALIATGFIFILNVQTIYNETVKNQYEEQTADGMVNIKWGDYEDWNITNDPLVDNITLLGFDYLHFFLWGITVDQLIELFINYTGIYGLGYAEGELFVNESLNYSSELSFALTANAIFYAYIFLRVGFTNGTLRNYNSEIEYTTFSPILNVTDADDVRDLVIYENSLLIWNFADIDFASSDELLAVVEWQII